MLLGLVCLEMAGDPVLCLALVIVVIVLLPPCLSRIPPRNTRQLARTRPINQIETRQEGWRDARGCTDASSKPKPSAAPTPRLAATHRAVGDIRGPASLRRVFLTAPRTHAESYSAARARSAGAHDT